MSYEIGELLVCQLNCGKLGERVTVVLHVRPFNQDKYVTYPLDQEGGWPDEENLHRELIGRGVVTEIKGENWCTVKLDSLD